MDPHLWGRTIIRPTQTTETPGHKPQDVNVVVVGPFEEEGEGIGTASDVIEVNGEDPGWSPAVVHRPSSDSPLHFDSQNMYT